MPKKTIFLLSILLSLIIATGCTSPPDTGDTSPEPPSSLAIDEGESAEEQAEDDEPVDSFIRTTELIQATDGSAVVQVVTETSLEEGTYQARYYDSEEGELSAPCLRIEGADNELQCSLALVGGLQLVEFQLFYLEPFEPLIPADEEFHGINLFSLIDKLEGNILPLGFQPEVNMNVIDSNNFFFNLCMEWNDNEELPDSLDPFCENDFPIIIPTNLGGNCIPGDICFLGDNDSHESTIPDPDCEGKDAGSFWCQETDEEQYLAGRLAHACLDQINTAFEDPLTAFEDPLTAFEDPLTAFEDPLTAFEDPLTAFEDPLTAFEDPLTAFEDPLTAFEDPLTAVDVARTTILYRVAYPSIPNSSSLPACNQLALLGDHSQFLRTGETLIEHMAGYYPPFKPVSDRMPLDTSDLAVMPAHCGYFDDMRFEDRHYFKISTHDLIIFFDAGQPLPGLHTFVFGDPTPYQYSATLGDVDLNCGMAGSTGLSCTWDNIPESLFNQDQEYALYVTGCDEPLHTGAIPLPAYDYNRCTVFEDMDMSLYVAEPSTNLSIAIEMANGIPGLEVEDYQGFDRLPVDYYSRFCGEQSFCEVYDWLPGYLYCNLTVTPDCLTNFNEFDLLVDNCPWPILSRTLQIITPVIEGNESGGGDSGPTCTGTEPNRMICEGHGGIWSGPSITTGTCTCP